MFLHKRRPLILLAGLSFVCACSDSLHVDFPFADAGVDAGPSALMGVPPCSFIRSPPLVRSIIDRSQLDSISPMGTPRWWDGVPSPGLQYVGISTDSEISVVAPTDGVWRGYVFSGSLAFASISICDSLSIIFGPVVPDPSWQAMPGSAIVDVHAGDKIGVVNGDHLEMVVADARTGWVGSPDIRQTFNRQAVCPFLPCIADDCPAYMAYDEATAERALVRDREGNAAPSDNECGTYPIEEMGTALGAWSMSPRPLIDPPDLYLVRDPLHAEVGLMSSHMLTALWSGEHSNPTSPGIFWVTFETSDPDTNQDFGQLRAGTDGGTGRVQCYQGLTADDGGSVDFSVLLQMLSDTSLQLELIPSANCESVRGPDRSFVFPMTRAVLLKK